MIYLNIFLITIILCLLVDITGVVESIKNWLKKWLNIRGEVNLKPFDCSLCMSHHINLVYFIYIYIKVGVEYPLVVYAYILFLAVNTTNITSMLLYIRDLIENIIQKLWSRLN